MDNQDLKYIPNNMKTTISVAIATYNEENNINNCLKSLNWVDQIIIADGSSTDNTVNIAKKYKNVKIISTDNKPIFHINKNIAIDKCTSDWILQLDADEVVSSQLKDEIIKKINSQPTDNGFWIPRKNYFLGRFLTKGGQYPDYTIRLYKNGYGRLPAQNVHEQATIDGNVGYFKEALLHYADISFSRYLLRNNRYTTLLAQELKAKKININLFSFLNYYFIKPIFEFLLIYVRHRGYVDGFPGFVFSFYSALRFPIAYTKYYELLQNKINIELKTDWD